LVLGFWLSLDLDLALRTKIDGSILLWSTWTQNYQELDPIFKFKPNRFA
jgi:hypothetical protein